ncbi:unnamed protein product [Cladocopium goreaui]|uniref:Diphthine--ammonia ligase (ATP-bindin g domain-containing protein 4) (Diphthamide synthase) (Diphthamide synthetase) (Protein DPH6 homolog) n=1 Tax=Cladocopium goreaui TaxID=2562237 RepID=A0A9P1CBF6_9DINO|nr:unnamed protein product [Cladocopium goreaui]
MDSYMYQTVGSELVNSIAEAMELPLVRRNITGAPKNLENGSYVKSSGTVSKVFGGVPYCGWERSHYNIP